MINITKFNYAVLFLKIETYLEDGMKFDVKIDNIIPFVSKELAEQYLQEIEKLGANVLLINLEELMRRM